MLFGVALNRRGATVFGGAPGNAIYATKAQ
jgi:hypothetical protein